MKQYIALGDTTYLWFASNDTKGSGGDGASPAADVRLAGAAADAAPVHSPTPVLLSHANYPAGAYEIAIAATAGNGFATNNVYAVFCTLAIDAQNPTGFVGSFDLKPVKATLDGEKVALSDATETQIDDIENAVIIKRATINDATPSTTKFITTLTETSNTFWPRAALLMTSGQNKGQIRGIKNYNGSTKEVQLQTPLSYAPANGNAFWIIPARKFLTPDIAGLALESTLTAIKGSGWTDETLKAIKAAIDAEVGPGALSCTWTQKDADENPMDNVQIWITTDEAGVNVIAGTLLTNAHGKATFMLDAGTYYVWREKAGKNFTNPQTWSVS